MARKILSVVSAVVGFAVLIVLVLYLASESGEIVVLQTPNLEKGGIRETRLWVVDHAGTPWLRAGNPKSAWFLALSEQPQVVLIRGEDALQMIAEPKPEERDTINDLMHQKYGWADSLVCLLSPRDTKVPVKLEPVTQSSSGR
jgi:hypothetical protein